MLVRKIISYFDADVDYNLRMIEGKVFLELVDLNKGGRTITEEAGKILDNLSIIIPGLKYCIIIYKDSDGIYDEIIYDGYTVSFEFIGAVSFEDAVRMWYLTHEGRLADL